MPFTEWPNLCGLHSAAWWIWWVRSLSLSLSVTVHSDLTLNHLVCVSPHRISPGIDGGWARRYCSMSTLFVVDSFTHFFNIKSHHKLRRTYRWRSGVGRPGIWRYARIPIFLYLVLSVTICSFHTVYHHPQNPKDDWSISSMVCFILLSSKQTVYHIPSTNVLSIFSILRNALDFTISITIHSVTQYEWNYMIWVLDCDPISFVILDPHHQSPCFFSTQNRMMSMEMEWSLCPAIWLNPKDD